MRNSNCLIVFFSDQLQKTEDFFGLRMQSDETEGYPRKWDTEVEGGKKRKERKNFMIVSAFSRKDSYDRRVSQKNYAQRILS